MKRLTSLFLYTCAFVMQSTLCSAVYYSENGQDKFAYDSYFKEHKTGVFCEIGAVNGIDWSNTYFFEKELGWTGMCVEPIPETFMKLKENRKCICVHGCVSNRPGQSQFLRISSPARILENLSGLVDKYDPRHMERINESLQKHGGSYEIIDVPCYTFNELVLKHGLRHINFLTIDTEGNELDILSSIDFSLCEIDLIAVEDNYDYPEFIPFFEKKGFLLVKRLGKDLIFANKDLKKLD